MAQEISTAYQNYVNVMKNSVNWDISADSDGEDDLYKAKSLYLASFLNSSTPQCSSFYMFPLYFDNFPESLIGVYDSCSNYSVLSLKKALELGLELVDFELACFGIQGYFQQAVKKTLPLVILVGEHQTGKGYICG